MSTFKWGKYAVNRSPIGQGKQGLLYKGFDPMRKRSVAVKKMENVESCRQEAFVMQTYGKHKHLTKYYDFFILNEKAYLVMEWIKGDSLRKKPKKYDEKTAVQITINLLNGLKHLHQKGFLHCDILPNNIMMTEGKPETVKLIDFGIAVNKGNKHIYKQKHFRRKETIFCPPEQRTSDWWILDESSDLYRTAGICVFLLTKKNPRLDRNTRAHRCTLMNKRLEHVLNKAMHPAREKRYRNAEEFIKALKPFA